MKDEQEKEQTYVLKGCAEKCKETGVECPFKECRHWIQYGPDNNCDLLSIHKNGEMTLREVGERLGISYVRVKQIESAAIKKIKKFGSRQLLED